MIRKLEKITHCIPVSPINEGFRLPENALFGCSNIFTGNKSLILSVSLISEMPINSFDYKGFSRVCSAVSPFSAGAFTEIRKGKFVTGNLLIGGSNFPIRLFPGSRMDFMSRKLAFWEFGGYPAKLRC